jgi:hypothetical protein
MEQEQKITKEQLVKINSDQQELQTVLTSIGVLELQKQGYLSRLADINKSIEEFKTQLEAEYGAISINLQDGSYTEIVKDEVKNQ